MNLISYLMIVIYFCFVKINCKSIHIHDDFHSEFEVSENKTLNQRHDSISKISWIKLKPIIRREMQYVRYVKGAESATLSAETTHQIPAENEEKSNKNLTLAENEEIDFNAETQINNNNILKTEMVKSNLTLMPGGDTSMQGEIASNNTNAETPKLDSPPNKNDFPYNITPDILNQSGDLIVFLAMDENGNKIDSLDSNETVLLNEGTTVTLDDISTTGLELLRDFKTKQNLIDINFPNIQRTLNYQKNLTNFEKDFNINSLERNRSEENILLKITEESPTISDIAEISTEKSEILNEQILEVSFKDEDDRLQVSLNKINFTDFINEQNNSGTNLTSTKGEMRELKGSYSGEKSNALEMAPIKTDINEIDNNEPDFRDFKNKENNSGTNLLSIQSEMRELKGSSFDEKSNTSEMASIRADIIEIDNKETGFRDFKNKENNSGTNLLSTQSEMRELQRSSSDDEKSNTSEIDFIKADRIEIENTEPDLANSFKDDKQTKVSSKKQSGSNCPDPGLCIFWFLAIDTCDEDSHCHGSLICCTWGCSKMCIDADPEMT